MVSVHSADITLQYITIPNKISLHSALVQFVFKAAFLDFHQWNELLIDSNDYLPINIQWLQLKTFLLNTVLELMI